MKNVTIALDEALLREVRGIAADRSTSLNALIREFLRELSESESKAVQARKRIVELCRASQAEVGSGNWTRDELHER
ncbi:MAG: ribbon-helix-helix protein, CopG family [Acidobacteriota bacterium]